MARGGGARRIGGAGSAHLQAVAELEPCVARINSAHLISSGHSLCALSLGALFFPSPLPRGSKRPGPDPTLQDSQRRLPDGLKLIALLTNPPPEPPPPENRDLSTLRDFFEYFDKDMKFDQKRYLWEPAQKRQWRHFIDNPSAFVTFICRVLEGVTKDIVRKAGKEHGGTGTGNRGERKGRDGSKKDGLGCLDQGRIYCITICIKVTVYSASNPINTGV